MSVWTVSLPPLCRHTVNLLQGEVVIEVGIRDGGLVAMVPGHDRLVYLRGDCRLRVVVSGLEAKNTLADVVTYCVTPGEV